MMEITKPPAHRQSVASFPGLPVSFGGHANLFRVAAEKAGKPGDEARQSVYLLLHSHITSMLCISKEPSLVCLRIHRYAVVQLVFSNTH